MAAALLNNLRRRGQFWNAASIKRIYENMNFLGMLDSYPRDLMRPRWNTR